MSHWMAIFRVGHTRVHFGKRKDLLGVFFALLWLPFLIFFRFTATQCLGHHAFNDRRTVRNHSQPPPLSRSESICSSGMFRDAEVEILIKVNLWPRLSSGSSTPRQIPRDNLLSSLHNSINDLSYSVEPQQRGSIEKYREIKDKVWNHFITNYITSIT